MTSDNQRNEEGLLRFWSLALQLKRVRRQGWIDRGVVLPESSADHSWGVALLAWMLARERDDLDRDRVLLLGLVHDLPEAVAGDVTPLDIHRDVTGTIAPDRFRELPAYDDGAKQAKRRAEESALRSMLEHIDASQAGDIRDAWNEYEEGATAEAKFVRQVDKLETLLQAEDYQARDPRLVIDSFRLGTARDVTDPELALLVAVLTRTDG